MAGIVEPIPVQDWGSTIRNALGVYRDVRQMEDQDEINQLAQNSYTDPVAWEQLKRKAPEKAAQIQQVSNVDLDRFFKYRAGTSLELIGKPPEQQAEILARKAKELKDQGRDPSNTLEMRQRILSGDKTVQPELQGYVEQGYQMGYLQRPPQQKSETTALQKNLAAAGIKPGTKEYRDAILAGTKGGVSVSIGGEKADVGEFGKALAKSQVKHYEETQTAAELAEEGLQSINAMREIALKTGKLEPAKQAIAAWGAAFGVDTSSLANVPAGQAFIAESQKLVNKILLAAAGVQTEGDAQRAQKTVANLGNDPRANEFIWDNAEATMLRQKEYAQFQEDWLNDPKNKSLDGMRTAWRKYIKDVPMIANNLKQDGLPMFFHKFERLARESDPNASREEIIAEWNRLDKEAKKQQIPTKKAIESARPIPAMINTYQNQQPSGQYGETVRPTQLSGRYGL